MLGRLTLFCGVVALACAAGLALLAHPALASSPSIALSVTTGTAGTPVTITGTNFPPGEIVALYIDQPGPYLDQPGPRADSQGTFHRTIMWPNKNYDATGRVKPTATGAHNVCGHTSYLGVTQPVEAQAYAVVVVQGAQSPLASPSPAGLAGPSGTAVAIVVAILIGLADIVGWLMRRTR